MPRRTDMAHYSSDDIPSLIHAPGMLAPALESTGKILNKNMCSLPEKSWSMSFDKRFWRAVKTCKRRVPAAPLGLMCYRNTQGTVISPAQECVIKLTNRAKVNAWTSYFCWLPWNKTLNRKKTKTKIKKTLSMGTEFEKDISKRQT